MTPESQEPASAPGNSVPEVKYFDRATEQVGHFDRLMVTLYSGLIAGTALLLLREEVSFWVGGFLFAALVMFTFGIGHALLHMACHHKVLFLMEALVNGTEHVPTATEREEPTVQAYRRAQRYAQTAYSGQLTYLFLGVCIAALGVVLRLWEYSWRAGILVVVVLSIFLGGLIARRLWITAFHAHAHATKLVG